MKLGSLFAGIGGFDLAARWMGWETTWFSEIEPYAAAVLKKHWPNVPNLGDITQITNPPPVDMLVGGFPCQDISLAGKGAGIEGARSGLWSHYARLIGEIRPRWVVAENVSALRSRGLDRVLRDLMALGYDAEWHCIPAAYVGAPHRRDRIWIVAYPAECGRQEGSEDAGGRGARDCAKGALRSGPCVSGASPREDVADSLSTGLEGHAGNGGTSRWEAESGSTASRRLRSGEDPSRWWSSEPAVGRVAHGIPKRVDRLRCLGNAVVPQIPYMIFRAIEAAECAS